MKTLIFINNYKLFYQYKISCTMNVIEKGINVNKKYH